MKKAKVKLPYAIRFCREARPGWKATYVLTRMRRLLSDPARWVQGTNHELGEGQWSHCMMGAWLECSGGDLHENNVALTAVARHIPASEHVGRKNITRWNDAEDRTHSEVLDVLDRAIQTAELWRCWDSTDSVLEAA